MTVSIACITAGCIIASAGDLEFDRRAYTTGALSVLAQAGYLTLVQMHSEKEKSSGEAGSALDMVYINSCNTLPVFLLASFLVGETSALGYSNSYSGTRASVDEQMIMLPFFPSFHFFSLFSHNGCHPNYCSSLPNIHIHFSFRLSSHVRSPRVLWFPPDVLPISLRRGLLRPYRFPRRRRKIGASNHHRILHLRRSPIPPSQCARCVDI